MKILLAGGFLFMVAMAASVKNEFPDDYLAFVGAIHPYETFSNPAFEDPEGILSRENYDLYLRVHARHYQKAFSLEEIEKIADFSSSDVGAKFLEFHRLNEPFAEFLNEVQKGKEQDAEATIWTCSDHPAIRSPEEGNCPICRKQLIPQR